MKDRKFKDSIFYTILMLLVFSFIVPVILQIPIALLNVMPDYSSSEVNNITVNYLIFPGITLISFAILFLFKENTSLRKIFTLKNNRIIYGLCIGFFLNVFRVFIAYLCGNIKLAFNDFNVYILIYSFICVLIQSASEEFVCRGYLFSKILNDYKKPLLAIIFNSIVFALFHVFNDGISLISLLGIFAVGIILSLFTYYSGNIWEAVAFHTMWNFTQAFIFGLPNSGHSSIYSVLRIVESKSGIAYHKVFGIEGTIIGILIDIILIIVIQLLHRKRIINES